MASEIADETMRERRGTERGQAFRHLPREFERPNPGRRNAPRGFLVRWPKWLGIGLLGLAIVSAALETRRYRARVVENSKATVVVATPRPLSTFALGRLEPLGRVVEVAAPEGGGNARIRSIQVKEGDRVDAGAVLAVLDHETRLKAEFASSERRLVQARARLEQALRIAESEYVGAVSSVRIAEIAHEKARMHVQRIARLYRSQAASSEEYDNAQRDLESAERTLAANRARSNRFASIDGRDPVDVAVVREEVAVCEAAVAEAGIRLQQAYVVAPIGGTVLTIRLRQGEYVAQRPILDMGATDRMTARVEVYESIVRKLSVGQSVVLRSPALESPLHGSLESISNVVRRQSIVDALPAANTDARVVEVVVRLDPGSSRIASRFVGLQVRAEFKP